MKPTSVPKVVSPEDLAALKKLINFVDNPEKYGCSIYLGIRVTYEKRIGNLFEDARAAIKHIQNTKYGPPMRRDVSKGHLS